MSECASKQILSVINSTSTKMAVSNRGFPKWHPQPLECAQIVRAQLKGATRGILAAKEASL